MSVETNSEQWLKGILNNYYNNFEHLMTILGSIIILTAGVVRAQMPLASYPQQRPHFNEIVAKSKT